MGSQAASSASDGQWRSPGETALAGLDTEGAAGPVPSSVEQSRRAATELAQVCAVAATLPRRDPGPLSFPPFRSLRRPR